MKKDTKSSELDKWLEENKSKIPYSKRLENGMWEIFTGEMKWYCEDVTYTKFAEMSKKTAAQILQNHKDVSTNRE